ncbi:MAG: hypothetical protein ACRD4B_04860, partial [Acidobacteriota bacterium]
TNMFHEIDFACDLSVVAWKSYESGNLKSAKALYERALRIFQRAKTAAEAVAVLIRLGLVLEHRSGTSGFGAGFFHARLLVEGPAKIE